jgi:hypothetical protein
MKISSLLACIPLLLFTASAFAQTPDIAEAHVIAAWHFDGSGDDASGHHHTLRLRGKDTQLVKDGKAGGALSIEEKIDAGDKRQGAIAQNAEDLNPKGAFTLEMWMSPGQQLASRKYAVLLDKKYFNYKSKKPEANTAYLLRLSKVADDQFVLEAQLGFGDDSAVIQSRPQIFEANQWYHVAFTYDGKGQCVFYVNNLRAGETQLKGRGAITPGTYGLVIGDRVGSVGQRFYGRIDEVRILDEALQYVSGKVLLDAAGSRTAFYRMETDAAIKLHLFNDRTQPLKNITAQIQVDGITSKPFAVADLQPGKSTFAEIPFDANLRPAAYEGTAIIKSEGETENLAIPITIVPRPLPHQMPIVMWARATKNYKELTDIGYTDELVNMVDYNYVLTNGNASSAMPAERAKTVREQLNDMLAAGIGGLASLNPGATLSEQHPEWNRVNRKGKEIIKGANRKKSNLDALYPEVQQFASNVGASVARTFGDLPGLAGTHINGEIRDRTSLSFHQIDIDAYRQFSGADIPAQAEGTQGVNYLDLTNFPASHIISDDDPLLTFYKWFWRKGDGWTDYISAVSDGFKSAASKSTFTMMDPGVRVPGLWGSGGSADYINQWTYTYPDPLKNDLATNESFAMTAGHPGQKVMNMTQIIWYRSGTTEPPAKGHETEWEKATPDAAFISIAPDHLSEATWLELAYPVDAIANHGWGSLGDHLGFKQGSYITTNVETRRRMTDIYQNIVKPLSPALLQVPDYQTDVAFLESFTSQMFAKTGTYGWGGGWGAESYFIARYAGLQPRIIYEEAIQKNGLDHYNVLFLTDCPVLPQSVADAIKKFQQRGGIVVGDEDLAPGIQPDIIINKTRRTTPDATKQLQQKQAATLRQELSAFYQAPLESDNPNVITRLRQFGDSRYIFAINDNRTYGDYVGQYKKVMEKGLPSRAQLTFNRINGENVYDLMNHRQVSINKTQNTAQLSVSLGAGEGSLFLVTKVPVGKLQIDAPSTAKRGNSYPVKVLLPDEAGKKLSAVIPLKVTIRDAEGRLAEKSGYYGAANGELQIDLDIAPNDAPGKWQIEVMEALTRQQQTKEFVVE